MTENSTLFANPSPVRAEISGVTLLLAFLVIPLVAKFSWLFGWRLASAELFSLQVVLESRHPHIVMLCVLSSTAAQTPQTVTQELQST